MDRGESRIPGIAKGINATVTALGGFFAGGMLLAYLNGDNVKRMVSGPPDEVVIQSTFAFAALLFRQ